MDYDSLFTEKGLEDLKLKVQYAKLDAEREEINSRNEKYAGWTLPTLFPRIEDNDTGEVQFDYQSLGAQLVNNLANKVVKTLFNPARPFFKADLSDQQRKELRTEFKSDAKLDAALGSLERRGLKAFNKTNSMTEYVKAAKLCIVTGECLIQSDSFNNKIVHSQRNYVVSRDRSGGTVRTIIKEQKRVSELPRRLQRICIRELDTKDPEQLVSLYTGVVRDGVKYYVWQEIEDFTVGHFKAGVYTIDTLPFKFMKWDWMKGRTYAIGLVEHNAGDFNALSRLASAIDDYTAIATDLKILVNPQGNTDIAGINNSASGAAVAGVEEDIHILKYEVAQVAEFLKWRFDELKQRLGAQFLLSSATTRDAERVTAEEIRRSALELENAHGGIYSRWSLEIQRPEAQWLLRNMDGMFSEIDVTIITGLDSLSRATELDNMRAYLTDLAAIAQVPDEVKIWLKIEDILAMLGAGHGIDYSKFIRTQEEKQAEEQRLMQLQAAQTNMQATADAQGQTQGQQPQQQ